MVVIRLARGGAKNRPFYNVVVADSRARRDGRFVERVGFYNPMLPKESSDYLRIEMERFTYWKSVGARITPTVARLIRELRGAPSAA
jgi:small subunit ribosomal protein S16